MSSGSAARAHVIVVGRVQGVGFRAYCRAEAQQVQVRGWVRNLPDGAVEAVFEGTREQVDKMIDWCRRGPPSARVGNVDVSWETPQGEHSFSIVH